MATLHKLLVCVCYLLAVGAKRVARPRHVNIRQTHGLPVDKKQPFVASDRGLGTTASDSHGHAQTTQLAVDGSNPGRSTLRVVLASDVASVKYLALLPLTCYLWRHRLAAHPLVFLVSRKGAPSPQARFVAHWIAKAGGQVEMVTAPWPHKDVTFAQVIRLAAFASRHVAEDDVLVTADADTWPLSLTFWRPLVHAALRSTRESVTVVNGDYYREKTGTADRVAISYIIAKAATWKTIVNDAVRESANAPCDSHSPVATASCILDAGARRYGALRWRDERPERKEDSVQWTWDQTFMTAALDRAVASHALHLRLGRGLKAGRLDRKGWAFGGDPEVHSDAHLPAPLTDDDVWRRLLELWSSLLQVEWATTYRALAVVIMKGAEMAGGGELDGGGRVGKERVLGAGRDLWEERDLWAQK